MYTPLCIRMEQVVHTPSAHEGGASDYTVPSPLVGWGMWLHSVHAPLHEGRASDRDYIVHTPLCKMVPYWSPLHEVVM